MATYNASRQLRINENPFDESFVEIKNTAQVTDGDTHARLQHFNSKYSALEFCKDNNIKFARVVRIESRFEFTWIVDLGRNNFLPRHAQAHIIMACFGKKLGEVKA